MWSDNITRRASRRTHLIIRVFEQQKLTLIKMLHTLLPSQEIKLITQVLSVGPLGNYDCTYHLAERLTGLFAPKEEASTTFQ